MAAATSCRFPLFPCLQCKSKSRSPESHLASVAHLQFRTSRFKSSKGTPQQQPSRKNLPQLTGSPLILTFSTYLQHRRRQSQVRAIANVEERVDDLMSREERKTLIKVCGVTCPEDAAVAAEAGADLIGMIMWPGSKRHVTVEQAAQISAAARQHGAEPVAVFVDGTAADIIDACAAADISIVQLHGDEARAALEELPPELKVVYVLHANSNGTIRTALPVSSENCSVTESASNLVRARLPVQSGAAVLEPRPEALEGPARARVSKPGKENAEESAESEADGTRAGVSRREAASPVDESRQSVSGDSELLSHSAPEIEWLLVDGVSAGSGETYDWTNLRLPQGLSKRGWLLAGGLDPANVAAALGAAQPDGVDVASGVAGLDKIRKDKAKVEAFIQAVKSVTT